VAYRDLNGDGAEDKIRTTATGVQMSLERQGQRQEHWQTNLPVAFTDPATPPSINGIWDVDGDGTLEAVAMASTADGGLWRILTLDALTGRTRATIDLPGGPDRRGDGRWDGHHRVRGVVTVPTDEGDRRALVVFSDAAFDQEPRGVRAVDAETGATLWAHLVGPRPNPYTIELTDLDADGTP
jgi:hypothetical protein